MAWLPAYLDTLQKFEIYAWWNVPAKWFYFFISYSFIRYLIILEWILLFMFTLTFFSGECRAFHFLMLNMNHGYVTMTTCIFGISLAICKFLLYVFFRQLLGGVISKFCPLVFHPINRNRYEHKGIYFLDLQLLPNDS